MTDPDTLSFAMQRVVIVSRGTIVLGSYLTEFRMQLVREAVGMHVTVQTALMRDVAEAALGAGVISDASLVANAAASLRPCSPIAANK